ncbi:hypothetical protein GTO91_16495 [Heliobacterium undosum]|uniref:Uncharacterized protein n=1 Tax=Heliomicrobium undosum TaxID=121734 RepID=A0A845LCB8_9FIRM|nr:hypothetical protein [Heliomicrobium undosum]MZP31308.1 hypothetical protein [Heliomicrobium undosum]
MIYFKHGLSSFFIIFVIGMILIKIAKVKLYKLETIGDRKKFIPYLILFLYLSLFKFAFMSSIFGERVSCRIDCSLLNEIKSNKDFFTSNDLRDAGIPPSFRSNSEFDIGYSEITGIVEEFDRNGSVFYLYRSREDALKEYNKKVQFARLFPLNPFMIQELRDRPNYQFLSIYTTNERDLPLFRMTDVYSKGAALLVNNLLVIIAVPEEWRDLDSNIVVDNSIIRVRSWADIPAPVLNERLRDAVDIITALNSANG